MCMKTFNQYKEAKSLFGYKVFLLRYNGTLGPCFYGNDGRYMYVSSENSLIYQIGKEYHAKHNLCFAQNGLYFTGFHVCKTLKDAQEYASSFLSDKTVIAKVNCIVFGDGFDESGVECYLAQRMYICDIVKDNGYDFQRTNDDYSASEQTVY